MPPAAPRIKIVALSTPAQNDIAATTGVEAAETVSIAAWPRTLRPPAAPGVQIASLGTPDPVRNDAKEAASSIEAVDECFRGRTLHRRVPLVAVRTDAQGRHEQGDAASEGDSQEEGQNTDSSPRPLPKYVLGDFTWKDPIAAQRAGMSLKDYVIGGMDRSFKLKLYRALRAMDDAGLMPGITSAFRDDYRQSITVGKKAASDSSYHGGSRRGGYGHGLAADLVSVKGENACATIRVKRRAVELDRCAREGAWDRAPVSRSRPAACGADRRQGIHRQTRLGERAKGRIVNKECAAGAW